MKKNKLQLIGMFVLLQTVFAQRIMADTIPIPEVLIQTSRELYYTTPNSNYKLDSFQYHYFGQNSIVDILQNFTPIQINTYGVGGIASVNLRGTADDQTSVFWNGIKINSITLGSSDLSLIPINAANKIDVITNASGAALGSGSFGGAILLENTPVFTKHISTTLRQDFSSFKNYKTNFSIRIGNNKVQFSSSSFYQQAKNNFPFFDKYKFDNPLSYNNHNAIKQWATVNELNIKLRKNQQVDLGNFIIKKFHELPALMGSYSNSEKYQKDFSVKQFIKYKKTFSNAQFYVRSGYIYDYLLYNDSVNNINAPYYLHQWQNSINYRHYFKHHISVDAGIDYILEYAKVTNYTHPVKRNRGAVFIGSKYEKKGLSVSLSARQEILKTKYMRPQFGIMLSYHDKKNILTTSLSYSDKYRLPDFNDLYWQPGGNDKLLPENGYSFEYNLTLNSLKATSLYQLQLISTAYYSFINNNIVWIPVSSALYSPMNIKKTQHWGIESTLKQTINIKKTAALNMSVNYNFNRSTIINEADNPSLNGHIIRYKPQHSIKAYLLFEDKYFTFGCNYLYVGKRFTDDENIKVFQLNSYNILDMFLSFKGYFKNASGEFVFKLNNITNTKYESVRSYAQPLRNYTISILINYKSTIK